MPQFDPSIFLSQVFWMLICFGVIFLSLSRKGVPRLRAIFAERFKKIEGQLVYADSLKVEAKKISEEVDIKLTDARNQAAETINAALHAANLLTAHRKSELTIIMKQRLAEAEKTIAQKKREASEDVKAIASETALSMSTLLASIKVKPEGAHQILTTILSEEDPSSTKIAAHYVS